MESNFWSIFALGPILREIGLYLDIADIISLSRTCTGLSRVYQELLRYHWNIDMMLKRFFERPKMFRQQLARSEALIFGSFAFEYFKRSTWKAHDLEVVVAEGNGAVSLINHILAEQKYEIASIEHRKPFKHIQKVVDLANPSQEQSHKVRLYVTSNDCFPVRAVVEGSWITAMVNFLSWNMAYSIFPSDTFLHRRSFLLKWKGANENSDFIEKYADSSLKFGIAILPDMETHGTAVRKARKIDDRWTWRIPFNTEDMESTWNVGLTESTDYVSMSHLKTPMDGRTLESFRLMGSVQIDGDYVHHWDVKYIRFSGLPF